MNDLIIATLVVLFFTILLAVYVLAIVDLHKRTFKTLSEKGKWLAIIWFLPLLGSAFYLLQGKRAGIRK